VLEEASLAPASFDFVLVDQVLEHISEPAPILRRFAAMLKPDRLSLVGVPDDRALAEHLTRAAKQPALLAQLGCKTNF
jgi:2-polyprenyl-3-methyl-5-hydroxy-6-metoxy-1,4-benzoquinol methylase